ncbi:hypothetical protein WKI65_01135 [Streptomyces sp. MS1.AVA.3]|uniref:hypothetical protein n=1 Tax=Streptomyces decoyicus TaxID=249567 RepID=UPI0030BBDB56
MALLLTTTGAAQAQSPTPKPTASAAAEAGVPALLAKLRAQGVVQGEGSLADLERQAKSGPLPSASAARGLPKCRGTFRAASGTVTLQESKRHGIPWGVKLSAGNAPQGVVRFSAKIFANKREANVYRTHKEPWSYHFHGPLPRSFDVKGSRKNYTMKRGDDVSFLWTWKSVRDPRSGGYRFVNCEFKP